MSLGIGLAGLQSQKNPSFELRSLERKEASCAAGEHQFNIHSGFNGHSFTSVLSRVYITPKILDVS
jgi:hypothetical protein